MPFGRVCYVDGVVQSASNDVRNVVAEDWQCLRLERSSLSDTAAICCGDIEFILLSAKINAFVVITQLVRNQSPFFRHAAGSVPPNLSLNGIFPDELKNLGYSCYASVFFFYLLFGERTFMDKRNRFLTAGPYAPACYSTSVKTLKKNHSIDPDH